MKKFSLFQGGGGCITFKNQCQIHYFEKGEKNPFSLMAFWWNFTSKKQIFARKGRVLHPTPLKICKVL